ncbi:MAG: hypothetical protein IPK59_19785 [Rhodospirillaceae bacterium]|nr:hypothetical protein [Rhodospirillaceae bacterium]
MSSQENDKDPDSVAKGVIARSSTYDTSPQARANGADGKVKPPQALDRWFDDQLNQLFNDVSTEPLPPDLARLIGQLKSQSQK